MPKSTTGIRSLTVIGCGLMGGSFALALKATYPHLRVTGVGRHANSLHAAIDLGVVDDVTTDLGAGVAQADVVLLGMPVGAMQATMQAIAPHLPTHCLVMDVGSTKSDVVEMAHATLGVHLPQFVAAHPIAGKESAGVQHAQAALYNGCRVILTPSTATNSDALAMATSLWQACGAQLHTMTAAEHDRVFAAVSHLPHLLAFAYINAVSDEQALALAGPGFRDFSRIAASSPDVWRDIFMANKAPLLQQLAAFERSLATFKTLVAEADRATDLHAAIAQASQRRAAWPLTANAKATAKPTATAAPASATDQDV